MNRQAKAKNIHVAFCVNDAYVRHLAVTVYSILENNKKSKITIHILSSDMTNESKELVNILAKVNKSVTIEYHSVNAQIFSHLPITMNYISRETYYRLILPDILPRDIKEVLYLDADIIVDGPLSQLYEHDLSRFYAAGVPDIYLDSDAEHKKSLGMDADETYINAGVAFMNLDLMRNDKICEKMMSFAGNKTYKYQDQDVLNGVLSGHVIALDKKFNMQVKDTKYLSMPMPKPVILHYSGSFKPWNRDREYDALSELYDKYKLGLSKTIGSHSANIKYGLLKYSTDNIGDSIQGIAARRFLPRVDYYFERDAMDETEVQSGETVKIIMNGWWGDGPENWPPLDQNLDVLPISMYVEDRIQGEFKKPRSIQFLNAFGPVGARSHGTELFLKKSGVDSYFSGCLTLTLNLDSEVEKQDYVLAVDVSDSVYEFMCAQTDRKVIRAGVLRPISKDENEQYKLAEFYLYLYQSAHAVVTTRLHAMLPCLALETPVLFIDDILAEDDVRFSGLSSLAHTMSAADYIKQPGRFNIDNPPANKRDFLKIRADLEKKCLDFTGYVSKDSYMTINKNNFTKDVDLLQAFLDASSKYGDLNEAKGIAEIKLSHKENHVIELTEKLSELKSETDKILNDYNAIQNSFSWKITKPIRLINRVIRLMTRR